LSLIRESFNTLLKRRIAWICACFALATFIVPAARACFRVEVGYNEGWNIYNARIFADHHLLYPARYGWTTVNYPMLSFVVMAQLHRLTHDYLFTARAVSLLSVLACSVLVGAIVRSLGGAWQASSLAAFYCLALFCTNANTYVGQDDPQMFAQVFFLAGLLVYLQKRESLFAIACAAMFFVVGGCIKHNPIDFPLALLLELTLISLHRALWFSACGILFAGVAVALNIHYGGPAFLGQLLAPRDYQASKIFYQMLNVFGPLLFPFCIAIYTAFKVRKDGTRRIAAILLATSLVVGGYFSGGQGVSINALFTALLATAILIGLFFSEASSAQWRWAEHPIAGYAPLLLFSWLLIPLIISGNWNPLRSLREIAMAQQRFDEDVELLRAQSGPALCESLLRCYFADKPYSYDPFNATRLIQFGKLNASVIVEDVRQQKFAAIQLSEPIRTERDSERFDPTIMAAIKMNYFPALEHKDAVIYIPKSAFD